MSLTLEIEFEGESRFVCGFTPEECRERADQLYGAGNWKEILIDNTRKFTCQD